MSKFHINSKGVPAPYKATKGNCPFGGAESHYLSIEDAQGAADKMNSKEFGILGKTSSSYSDITDKINNNEVLNNLHEIPNHWKRRDAALKEVNEIVAEKMAQEFTPEINEAYQTFINDYREPDPWDNLRHYATNKGYFPRIVSSISDDFTKDNASKSINASPEENIKTHEERLSSLVSSDPINRINVMVEDKKMSKKKAKELIEGGISENANMNTKRIVEVWERANEALKNSNVKWETLEYDYEKYDNLNPEEKKEMRKYGFAKFYGEFNDGENVEKIKNSIK